MGNHKAEKFYNSLVQLQSDLEKTVVKKCQQLIEEIFHTEKQALLQNIHKLMEDEFSGLLDSSQSNLNSQCQRFRCDSCNKNFSSTNIGQITITPTDNGMTFENSNYYNESECQNPFMESENYDEQDQSSNEMPDIKPIVEILQYDHDPLNSNNLGENSSSLSVTSNGMNEEEPIANYSRNKDANLEIINALTSVQTPTSSSALHHRKIFPQSQFSQARIKMRPFKSHIDKRSTASAASSEDRIKRIFALSKRNPFLKQSPRTVVPNSADSSSISNRIGLSTRASFACPLCSYVFNNSGKLERHLRSHTGEKPFACTYCSKRFGGKSNLLSHLRNHTGETPYECSTCHVKFKFSYSLTHHMKRYHSIIN